MFCYYKVNESEKDCLSPSDDIQVFEENVSDYSEPHIEYDFTKHVLIELLDNVTPEAKLWTEMGVLHNKKIVHKRLLVDPHRFNCRRAIVVCSTVDEAKDLAQRLSQTKIMRRCVCAVVIQELLSDLCLFEKQVMRYGDKRSQQQLVYVTDLTRCREPTGLVQYLREKFSPFGTILSIFVSEDKDGYAFPEAVIKFAHLSEAFAAELAYDQCAIAMERLSVTTHHNIVLSQCDLRARLREVQSKHTNETYSTITTSPNNCPSAHISAVISETKNDSSKQLDLPSCVKKKSENSSLLKTDKAHKSGATDKNCSFPDSEELGEALADTSQNNLMDCINGIAAYTESSVSRRSVSDEESDDENMEKTHASQGFLLPTSPGKSSVSVASDRNRTWTSRVMGWITDLPNPHEAQDIVLESSFSDPKCVTPEKSTPLFLELQSRGISSPEKSLSSVTSFVTCRNGVASSLISQPSSPVSNVNDDDRTLKMDSVSSPAKSGSSISSYTGNGFVRTLDSSAVTTAMDATHPLQHSFSQNESSLKRKNLSVLTEKLSLKSQRVESCFDGEQTIPLPSQRQGSENKCSVVLDCMPELNKFAKDFAKSTSPPIQMNMQGRPVPLVPELPSNPKKLKTQKENKGRISSRANSTTSSNSIPTRRSSRIAGNLCDRTNFSCGSIKLAGQNSSDYSENVSPLRAWLRKELEYSTNNYLVKPQESAKNIVCAATNKDVLISVGCSHITCDYCYPDSTKLLLGFQ